MKHFIRLLALALCITSTSCSPYKASHTSPQTLTAAALQPFGRFQLDGQQNLELISTAAHFGFSFEGKECQVFAALADRGAHNYLQYELDGQYIKRVRISGDSSKPVTITAPHAGKHTVWIYKATEAYTGPVLIQKVTGAGVTVLKRPAAPLIEFIGNSITCGAAADASEVPCGTGAYHDQHNAYYAYGPRVARLIGANYMISGVSGIGIYRNWNSDGPTMPQVYEKPDFQLANTKTWNFSSYNPQVVSIALGTNDFSNGDGKKQRLPFDSASFVDHYIRFVQLVNSKYPKAQIALLSSPMVKGNNRTTLQNCLTAVKKKVDALQVVSKPIALFFFQPMELHGCTGHPSVEDHAILAGELEPFFRKLLQ